MINEAIRASELRVVGEEGENLGILSKADALKKSQEAGLDLIEISPNAKPPVAKIMDYGKFAYVEKKKASAQRAKSHRAETKNVQVKIATGEHDLALKAKRASVWLEEGHRVKVELYLRGRSKYLDKNFLNTRIDRFLKLLRVSYKVESETKKGPKGLFMIIAKDK